MAEQDKDLPLVVAEILIEMHGMNDRLKNFEKRLDKVENLLIQVVDNIQQLSTTVRTAVEQTAQQQEVYNRNFRLLQDANQHSTEMLAAALQNTIATVGRRMDNLENRLERLENN